MDTLLYTCFAQSVKGAIEELVVHVIGSGCSFFKDRIICLQGAHGAAKVMVVELVNLC